MPKDSELWTKACQILKITLTEATFEMWIAPLHFIQFDNQEVTLAADSAFNRQQVIKRHQEDIQSALAFVLKQSVTLRVIVQEGPKLSQEEQPALESTRRHEKNDLGGNTPETKNNPLLGYVSQNEANLLLERYGDVIETIKQHPLLQKATDTSQNGWKLYPQALTNMVKAHSVTGDLSEGLAIVLAAAREVANYKAARDPGKLFCSVSKRYAKEVGNQEYERRLLALREAGNQKQVPSLR